MNTSSRVRCRTSLVATGRTPARSASASVRAIRTSSPGSAPSPRTGAVRPRPPGGTRWLRTASSRRSRPTTSNQRPSSRQASSSRPSASNRPTGESAPSRTYAPSCCTARGTSSHDRCGAERAVMSRCWPGAFSSPGTHPLRWAADTVRATSPHPAVVRAIRVTRAASSSSHCAPARGRRARGSRWSVIAPDSPARSARDAGLPILLSPACGRPATLPGLVRAADPAPPDTRTLSRPARVTVQPGRSRSGVRARSVP